jgi:hypothetical protein
LIRVVLAFTERSNSLSYYSFKLAGDYGVEPQFQFFRIDVYRCNPLHHYE